MTVAPPKQPLQSTQPTVQSTVAEKRAQAVQMQIFLDTSHFRPGMVDGRPGEFFDKALALYNANHGKPVDEQPDVAGIEPYTTYKTKGCSSEKSGPRISIISRRGRGIRLAFFGCN